MWLYITFVTLFGVATVMLVNCQRYKLMKNGYVDVTLAQRTCLSNKQTMSVPVKLVGVVSEVKAPRNSFTSKTQFNAMDGVEGDERGHLVGATFGGPADDSWNMVPQHRSVNRKISKQSNIIGRWEEFEKWMFKEIDERKNSVQFTIKVNYADASGCRPVSFEVDAKSSASSNPGFAAEFDNRPDDSFNVSALTQTQMKAKKP